MIVYIEKRRHSLPFRLLSALIAFNFTFTLIIPPSHAQLLPQTFMNLPVPGTMLTMSPEFVPTLIKGITIHPENPLLFDFIMDTGNSKVAGEEFKKESMKLVKYFLASLTVPEEDMWVNLSPYEKDRIIPERFGVTEMGRDLLAQDYILKQLTASLMYPENELGQKFWDRVRAKAKERFGTTDIPMNTFNKIWIVPNKASVLEYHGTVFVKESSLKVLLEEDYLALAKNLGSEKFGTDHVSEKDAKAATNVTTQIVREILIPEIEKEVNEGKNFANLRQIYNGMVLATWYKIRLKESLLGAVYVDKNKTKGVDIEDKNAKTKIYNQYLEAFKKGVYEYIKEDYDPKSQEITPRKYFSGGFKPVTVAGIPLRQGVQTDSTIIPIERPYASLSTVEQAQVTCVMQDPTPETIEQSFTVELKELDKDTPEELLSEGRYVQQTTSEPVANVTSTALPAEAVTTTTKGPDEALLASSLRKSLTELQGSVQKELADKDLMARMRAEALSAGFGRQDVVNSYVNTLERLNSYATRTLDRISNLVGGKHISAEISQEIREALFQFRLELNFEISKVYPSPLAQAKESASKQVEAINTKLSSLLDELSGPAPVRTRSSRGSGDQDGAMLTAKNFQLGNLGSSAIKVRRFKNRMTLTNAKGEKLTVDIKPYSNQTTFTVGNQTYLVKEGVQDVDLSKINPIGNDAFLKFFNLDINDVKLTDFQFVFPLDDPQRISDASLFPANRNWQPKLMAPKINTDTVKTARAAVKANSKKVTMPFNQLLHLVAVLGQNSVQTRNAEDYKIIQQLLNNLVASNQFPEYRNFLVGLSDYIFLGYVGIDWIKWIKLSKEIQEKLTKGEEKGLGRTKTLFELSVEPTRLPVDDPENWEVVSIRPLVDEDAKFVSEDPNDPIFQLGDADLKAGRTGNIPVAGGSATTPKKAGIPAHKMVHPAFKVVAEKDGVELPDPIWISVMEARLGLILGQNPNSSIIPVTSVAGTSEGESERSIQELLQKRFPDEVARGQIQTAIQRQGLVLDPQTGYPLRSKDGHIATTAEDHLWAYLAVLAEKNMIINLLQNSNGIVFFGNGDNVVNYARAGMLGEILNARNSDNPIATIGLGVPTPDHKKGGIFVETTYRNKLDPTKVITQKEIREISEFPTRNKQTGYDAIDLSSDQGSRVYQRFEQNGLFIEDLMKDKNVVVNAAFYAHDIRLVVARLFGKDENSLNLVDELRQIDDQTWADKVSELGERIVAQINTSKEVPNELGDKEQTVKGVITVQKVQDLIVNALGILSQDGKSPRMEILKGAKADYFLDYKGVKKQPLDEDGNIVEDAPAVLDIEGNQVRFAQIVRNLQAQGHKLMLGGGMTVARVIPVTLDEIIVETKKVAAEREDNALLSQSAYVQNQVTAINLKLRSLFQAQGGVASIPTIKFTPTSETTGKLGEDGFSASSVKSTISKGVQIFDYQINPEYFNPVEFFYDLEKRISSIDKKGDMRESWIRFKAQYMPVIAAVGVGPSNRGAIEAAIAEGFRVHAYEGAVKYGGLAEYGIYLEKDWDMKDGYRDEYIPAFVNHPNVNYYGNMRVGEGDDSDITFDQLRQMGYAAIIAGPGAQKPKAHKITNAYAFENNVYEATDLTSSYNGNPRYQWLKPKLGRRLAIIGAGNVAVDVTNYAIHKKDYRVVQRFVAGLTPEQFDLIKAELAKDKVNEDLLHRLSFYKPPVGRMVRMDEFTAALNKLGLTDMAARLQATWDRSTDLEQTEEVTWLIRREPRHKKFDPIEMLTLAAYIDRADLDAELNRIYPDQDGVDQSEKRTQALRDFLYKQVDPYYADKYQADSYIKEFEAVLGTKTDKAKIRFRFLSEAIKLDGDLAAKKMEKIDLNWETGVEFDSMVRSMGNETDDEIGLPMSGGLASVELAKPYVDERKIPESQWGAEGLRIKAQVQAAKSSGEAAKWYRGFNSTLKKIIPGLFEIGWFRSPSYGKVGLARQDGREGFTLAVLPFLRGVVRDARDFNSQDRTQEELGLTQGFTLPYTTREGSKGKQLKTHQDILPAVNNFIENLQAKGKRVVAITERGKENLVTVQDILELQTDLSQLYAVERLLGMHARFNEDMFRMMDWAKAGGLQNGNTQELIDSLIDKPLDMELVDNAMFTKEQLTRALENGMPFDDLRRSLDLDKPIEGEAKIQAALENIKEDDLFELIEGEITNARGRELLRADSQLFLGEGCALLVAEVADIQREAVKKEEEKIDAAMLSDDVIEKIKEGGYPIKILRELEYTILLSLSVSAAEEPLGERILINYGSLKIVQDAISKKEIPGTSKKEVPGTAVTGKSNIQSILSSARFRDVKPSVRIDGAKIVPLEQAANSLANARAPVLFLARNKEGLEEYFLFANGAFTNPVTLQQNIVAIGQVRGRNPQAIADAKENILLEANALAFSAGLVNFADRKVALLGLADIGLDTLLARMVFEFENLQTLKANRATQPIDLQEAYAHLYATIEAIESITSGVTKAAQAKLAVNEVLTFGMMSDSERSALLDQLANLEKSSRPNLARSRQKFMYGYDEQVAPFTTVYDTLISWRIFGPSMNKAGIKEALLEAARAENWYTEEYEEGLSNILDAAMLSLNSEAQKVSELFKGVDANEIKKLLLTSVRDRQTLLDAVDQLAAARNVSEDGREYLSKRLNFNINEALEEDGKVNFSEIYRVLAEDNLAPKVINSLREDINEIILREVSGVTFINKLAKAAQLTPQQAFEKLQKTDLLPPIVGQWLRFAATTETLGSIVKSLNAQPAGVSVVASVALRNAVAALQPKLQDGTSTAADVDAVFQGLTTVGSEATTDYYQNRIKEFTLALKDNAMVTMTPEQRQLIEALVSASPGSQKDVLPILQSRKVQPLDPSENLDKFILHHQGPILDLRGGIVFDSTMKSKALSWFALQDRKKMQAYYNEDLKVLVIDTDVLQTISESTKFKLAPNLVIGQLNLGKKFSKKSEIVLRTLNKSILMRDKAGNVRFITDMDMVPLLTDNSTVWLVADGAIFIPDQAMLTQERAGEVFDVMYMNKDINPILDSYHFERFANPETVRSVAIKILQEISEEAANAIVNKPINNLGLITGIASTLVTELIKTSRRQRSLEETADVERPDLALLTLNESGKELINNLNKFSPTLYPYQGDSTIAALRQAAAQIGFDLRTDAQVDAAYARLDQNIQNFIDAQVKRLGRQRGEIMAEISYGALDKVDTEYVDELSNRMDRSDALADLGESYFNVEQRKLFLKYINNLFLMGPNGAGKGTVTALFTQMGLAVPEAADRFVPLSTGDYVVGTLAAKKAMEEAREKVKKAIEEAADAAAKVAIEQAAYNSIDPKLKKFRPYVELITPEDAQLNIDGKLITLTTIVNIVNSAFDKDPQLKITSRLLFDGFPRTQEQWGIVPDLMNGRLLQNVLFINLVGLTPEIIRERSRVRREKALKGEGILRPDDEPKKVDERIKVFADVIAPMIDQIVQEQGNKVIAVNGGTQGIVDVRKEAVRLIMENVAQRAAETETTTTQTRGDRKNGDEALLADPLGKHVTDMVQVLADRGFKVSAREVVSAFNASLNKSRMLNDIAETVGISPAAALKNMKEAGLITEAVDDFTLTDNFYTTDVIGKLVEIQKRSSSDREEVRTLVDSPARRFERIILSTVDVVAFFSQIVELGEGTMSARDIVNILRTKKVMPVLAAKWRMKIALSNPRNLNTTFNPNTFVNQGATNLDVYKRDGINVSFNVPEGLAVDQEQQEAVKEYLDVMREEMSLGGFNYRGTGTEKSVMDYFEQVFAKEWFGKIKGFIKDQFDGGKKLKVIITNGIGANDQFMWSLVEMYNRNKKESDPYWYHVVTARDMKRVNADLRKRGLAITSENTLEIDISRSGSTWEGVEVAARNKAIRKRIVIANGGALKAIGDKIESESVGSTLTIHIPPDIGGRNMHRKTPIYYTAQAVVGMFLPSMDADFFAQYNHEYDVANGFDQSGSLATASGQFLHSLMMLRGIDKVAFISNSKQLGLIGTELRQYFMEGSNKEDVISWGEHDLSTEDPNTKSEPEYVLRNLANSPAGQQTMGIVILDKAAANYQDDLRRVTELQATMPAIVFTIDSRLGGSEFSGLLPQQQAAFDILWTDFITTLTTFLGVDANSNPNVKVVRGMTKEYVKTSGETAQRYAADPVGRKEAVMLVSLGTPGTDESSAIGTSDKQLAVKTIEQAQERGRELAQQVGKKVSLSGRNRLNIFVGTDELRGFARDKRNELYDTELLRRFGITTQTAVYPQEAHKGHEATLAYRKPSEIAAGQKPLLANLTLANFFLNQRNLGDDPYYNTPFENTTGMPDYDNVNGATVHQTNDSMTFPNIQRAAQVAPVVLLEFENDTDEVRRLMSAFIDSFTAEMDKIFSSEDQAQVQTGAEDDNALLADAVNEIARNNGLKQEWVAQRLASRVMSRDFIIALARRLGDQPNHVLKKMKALKVVNNPKIDNLEFESLPTNLFTDPDVLAELLKELNKDADAKINSENLVDTLFQTINSDSLVSDASASGAVDAEKLAKEVSNRQELAAAKDRHTVERWEVEAKVKGFASLTKYVLDLPADGPVVPEAVLKVTKVDGHFILTKRQEAKLKQIRAHHARNITMQAAAEISARKIPHREVDINAIVKATDIDVNTKKQRLIDFFMELAKTTENIYIIKDMLEILGMRGNEGSIETAIDKLTQQKEQHPEDKGWIEKKIALIKKFQGKGTSEFSKDEIKAMAQALKDTADAFGMIIIQRTAVRSGVIFVTKVTEGQGLGGRDDVPMAFKVGQVYLPKYLEGERADIEKAVKNGEEYFVSKLGTVHLIAHKNIDVVEGTNETVGKASLLNDMGKWGFVERNKAGGISSLTMGPGVKNLGNAPDAYVHQLFTNFGRFADDFRARATTKYSDAEGNPYLLTDVDLYATHPEAILEYYQFVAETHLREANPDLDEELRGVHTQERANEIIEERLGNGKLTEAILNLQEEIVIMGRSRETAFIKALAALEEAVPGLEVVLDGDWSEAKEAWKDLPIVKKAPKDISKQKGVIKITIIKDGTVTHGLKAGMTSEIFKKATGVEYGWHQTTLTVGGSAEGYMNLAMARVLKKFGAVGFFKTLSAFVGVNETGEVMLDLSRGKMFRDNEIAKFNSIGLDEKRVSGILAGTEAFDLDSVQGDVFGSFGFITDNQVFQMEAPKEDGDDIVVRGLVMSLENGRIKVEMVEGRGNRNKLLQEDDEDVLVYSVVGDGFYADEALVTTKPSETMQEFEAASAPDKKTNLGEKKYGGINLNPALLDLQIKRDGQGIPLPMNQQPIENMHIEGFLPVFIKLTTITDLPLMLGINIPADKKDDEKTDISFNVSSLPVEYREEFLAKELELVEV